jgi:hypothetical protein
MNPYELNEFPSEVIDEIQYYVYRLIDPRNGETFYVGKGKGNRVFNHIKLALKKDEANDPIDDKLQTIHAIKNAGLDVIHVIHRHGLDETTALEVEAALIDAYPSSTNIMSGSGSNERGSMNAAQIINNYKAEKAVFQHNVLMIIINKSISDNSVYDATRFAWKIDKRKAEKAEYILSIQQGIIVGVFIAKEWKEGSKENFPEFNEDRKERYGFIGYEAPAEIKDIYMRKRIPDEYRKKGAANPIKYNF